MLYNNFRFCWFPTISSFYIPIAQFYCPLKSFIFIFIIFYRHIVSPYFSFLSSYFQIFFPICASNFQSLRLTPFSSISQSIYISIKPACSPFFFRSFFILLPSYLFYHLIFSFAIILVLCVYHRLFTVPMRDGHQDRTDRFCVRMFFNMVRLFVLSFSITSLFLSLYQNYFGFRFDFFYVFNNFYSVSIIFFYFIHLITTISSKSYVSFDFCKYFIFTFSIS